MCLSLSHVYFSVAVQAQKRTIEVYATYFHYMSFLTQDHSSESVD